MDPAAHDLRDPDSGGHVHLQHGVAPEFGDRRLLVSWNTGVTGGAWWPDDLTLMRPRFAWVAWSCLGGRP
jgi:hypothetical protein